MITVTSLQSGKAAKTPYRHLFSTDCAALRALRPAVFSGASAVVVVPDGVFYNYCRDVVALVNAARPTGRMRGTTSAERRAMSIAF
jgi:hypothetical protein